MKNKLILLFMLVILTSVISAQVIFTQDEEADFKRTCTLNGGICSNAAECNISIKNPNQDYAIKNSTMTNQLNGDFNITLTAENTSRPGDYIWDMYCCDTGQCGSGHGTFKVTATGREFNSSQGLISLGIIITALTLAFIFLIIGFRLEANPKTLAIGFLFVILALILGLYSLHLSYVYSHDILEYETLTPVTSTIYVTVIYLLSGIIILSAALMLIAFIKELDRSVKMKKFGEGFNPITNTYDF